MAGRRLQGLQLLVLLWACVHPSLADDQDKSAIITASRGPETRVVSNATELGRALQDHFVTNIIIKGKTADCCMARGLAQSHKPGCLDANASSAGHHHWTCHMMMM